MTTTAIAEEWRSLTRGESGRLAGWLEETGSRRLALSIATIIVGCGIYGATIGLWHGPLMALYVGIKLPLIIFVTLAINGLLNGMLAQLLGSGLSFRQTMQAILMSFTVFSLIVGSLAPLTFFMVWNVPAPESAEGAASHSSLLLTHTFMIAFAGIVATQKLFGILRSFAGNFGAAFRTLIAWLAGNLFAGAQISYLLRPIFGTPGLEVQFLRWGAITQGNFYESVWWALRATFGG